MAKTRVVISGEGGAVKVLGCGHEDGGEKAVFAYCREVGGCVCVCLSCLHVYVCLSVNVYVYLSTYIYIYIVAIYMSSCLPVCLSVCLSI